MTPDRIKQLRELCERYKDCEGFSIHTDNQKLIALINFANESRTAMPELLDVADEYIELKQKLDRIKDTANKDIDEYSEGDLLKAIEEA